MCGINGFNFRDEELIKKMNEVTRHRGPDDQGLYLDDGVSLGHNRLSILDLTPAGHQPMFDASDKLAIVFNGEIYNFGEIKRELPEYPFKSASDTEVILAAFLKWGADCVKRFNGIFALAIWNKETKELFLARDHVGVKPLYYFWDGQRLIFSSEIKAILEAPIPREIDLESLNNYFRLLYVPAPKTIWKGIYKLPAAHFAKLADGKMEIKKYWEITDFENLSSKDEAVGQIRELFRDSVRGQVISERPVGVYLSGGIDSTAVLGAIREVAPQITKTYTVGFKDVPQEEKYNADFRLARETAKHYGTDHHELLISGTDLLNNFEKICWHMDEPNANATSGAIYLLSAEAKKDVAVVLGGDGGDELFGGYPRYKASLIIGKYQKMPGIIRAFGNAAFTLLGRYDLLRKFRLPADSARMIEFLGQKENVLAEVLNSNILNLESTEELFKQKFTEYNYPSPRFRGDSKNRDGVLAKAREKHGILAKARSVDFEKYFGDFDRQNWLTDESLMRTDRMTMARGVEARVPILDRRLIELANKIPTSWKIRGNAGKVIWKEAMDKYLPSHIKNEKKRGFFSPMSKWLRKEFKDLAYDTVAALDPQYFNRDQIRQMLDDHISGKRYNMAILWAVVTWGTWQKLFFKKFPPKSA